MSAVVVVVVFPVADEHAGLGQRPELMMLPMSRWWGRLARSTFVFAFVALVSNAAGRRQRTGRSGLRGAWCRPYWDMPIDRSVPPTMKGDVFHDGHRDRCAQAQPYRGHC